MTADDLTRLRAVAEAATPGPWRWTHGLDSRALVLATDETFSVKVDGHADAEFIATFDPPTVAALIDRVERAERQVAAVRQLAAEFESDGLQRWGGNIAWHIEEVLTEGADDGQ